MEFKSRNTNTLSPMIYGALLRHGVHEPSRNGPVLRFPEPVTIEITNPCERVNFCPQRDCNPFFHLMEGMAMLANVNNIPFLAHFAKSMEAFSDNGQTQNAFYGERARETFNFDQLHAVIRNLKKDPNSRQEFVLFWHPRDLFTQTKDKACNLGMIFSIVDGRLRMTSVNRSNDAIWGMVSGANIVHLSMFHEYVARALHTPVGSWFHFSNNLHIYTENPKWASIRNLKTEDFYSNSYQKVMPLFGGMVDMNRFDQEVRSFVASAVAAVADKRLLAPAAYQSEFVQDAATIFDAWQMRKMGGGNLLPLDKLGNVMSDDWRWACQAWIVRRQKKGETN